MKTKKVHYYKFITSAGAPIIAPKRYDFKPYLPGGSKGKAWLPRRVPVEMCERGWHVLHAAQIAEFAYWHVDPFDRLFEVETTGQNAKWDNKAAFESIRFIREIKRWAKCPSLNNRRTIARFIRTLNLK